MLCINNQQIFDKGAKMIQYRKDDLSTSDAGTMDIHFQKEGKKKKKRSTSDPHLMLLYKFN